MEETEDLNESNVCLVFVSEDNWFGHSITNRTSSGQNWYMIF